MGPNRLRAARARRPPTPERALHVWRGVLLVAVGGAGLGGTGAAFYLRQGDVLTGGLFTASVLLLLALGAYATVRARRLARA